MNARIALTALLVIGMAAAAGAQSSAISFSLNSLSPIAQGETAVLTATVTASGGSVSNVQVEVTLPAGLSTSDAATQSIGTLSSGQSDSKSWTITGDAEGTFTINVAATGTSVTTQNASASLVVSNSADISSTVLTAPPASKELGNSFDFSLQINNNGGASADTQADLTLSDGLTRNTGPASWTATIEGGGQASNAWNFTMSTCGNKTLSVTLTSNANDPEDLSYTILGTACSSDDTGGSTTSDDTTSSNTGTSGTTPAGGSAPTGENVPAGAAKTFTISENSARVTQVTIKAKNALSNVIVDVALRNSPSTSIPWTAGQAYRFMDITTNVTNKSSIETATVRFSVTKNWIENNGFSESDVFLARLSNGTWEKLPTRRAQADADQVHYEATTEGFSEFAIVAVAPAEACTGVNCDDGNPCTNDACKAGSCVHENKANGTDCGNGNTCQDGICTAPTGQTGDTTGTTTGDTTGTTGEPTNDNTGLIILVVIIIIIVVAFAAMRGGGKKKNKFSH